MGQRQAAAVFLASRRCEEIIFIKRKTIILWMLLWPAGLEAQNQIYTQLANQLKFNRTINDKWAGEVWLGGAFSNTPSDNRVLSTNIQRYGFIYVNYQHSSRWKFSPSLAYYYNKDVPDIVQFPSTEYRLTLQSRLMQFKYIGPDSFITHHVNPCFSHFEIQQLIQVFLVN